MNLPRPTNPMLPPDHLRPSDLGPTHIMGAEELTHVVSALIKRIERLEQCRAPIAGEKHDGK